MTLKSACLLIIMVLFTVASTAGSEPAELKNKLTRASNDTAKINILLSLADFYLKNTPDSALHYIRQAFALSNKNNNYKSGHINYAFADFYTSKGNYKTSIECGLKALKHNGDDKELVASIHLLMGITYILLDEHKLARQSIKRANEISNSYSIQFKAYVYMAQIFTKEDEFSTAELYFNKALALAQKEQKTQDIAILYNRLGDLFLEDETTERSLSYFQKSLSLLDPSNVYYKVVNLRGITECHILSGKYQKGLEVARLADSLALAKGFLGERRMINDFIAEIYDSIRNYKLALHYYKKFTKLKDSLINIETTKHVNYLQTEFDTKQKELQLRVLQKESTLQKRTIFIYAIISLLFIIFLFYLIKTNRQKNKILTLEKDKLLLYQEREYIEKQKLEIELSKKNRELLTNSLLVNQQKEVLSTIQNKLSQILAPEGESDKSEAIKNLNEEIRTNISLSDDWPQIKIHFEKVHPKFFDQLKTQYPDLSVNELKICAYTKMKFSNKEIGRLLNINTSSVHIARYRLKKKMNLNEEINLDEFIMSF